MVEVLCERHDVTSGYKVLKHGNLDHIEFAGFSDDLYHCSSPFRVDSKKNPLPKGEGSLPVGSGG